MNMEHALNTIQAHRETSRALNEAIEMVYIEKEKLKEKITELKQQQPCNDCLNLLEGWLNDSSTQNT